ncbi:APC family permease [Adlercreutzia muris]|uniref:Amino acid permease n=1 Tax=Adlercreutzia muris TaxID=1796610 RepID=A0A7C8FX63_9ACTN|nr:amino acid permease [Adlercreutzia muris]MCI9494962.1 amino acid permease [Adlercreutzia mucosicola]MCI9673724.1 amino acid permease [Enterorhabdus sp.]KAB1650650.1 amino acid permease [Adlercreutzia muris]MCR2028559.1 amino acid permease [Adlercreutzia muris]MCU7585377.1 amino acid permease [Adlercreutzia muris]
MSAPYDDNNPAATPPTLRRQFGLREAVTITVGTVIGVGLFTTGGNIVGLMGPSVIIATLVAMLVSIYPALLYAEMGAALPYAGGTYQYAGLGLGRPLGMLAGWNFIISLVAVTGGESLAFAYYFKTVFLAIGIELPVPDVVLACIALVLFIVTNVRGVQITGRLQNGFMFFFWGVAVIWFLTMIPEVSLPTFVTAPTFLGSMDAFGFIAAVAMIWWCFAGFETCCGMGEEIRYPSINIPRALKLAPFIIFAVNGAFQWFLVGITPVEAIPGLAEAAAPYAEAMMSAGILGLPLLLLALGVAFGGDFSTLNASIAVPPRYLFTMARDGAMPRVFAKVHPRFRTPYVAIIALGALSILLVATSTLDFIASLSLFADLFYYIIGIAAALGLRRRMPDLARPFRVPGVAVGVPVSIVIYAVMMSQLGTEPLVVGAAWCVIGLAVFFICQSRYGKPEPVSVAEALPGADEVPGAEEAAKMDREYRAWKIVVTAACIVVALLYAVPMLAG